MSAGTANLNWLITRFVQAVPAVRSAVVVSSDGLALAVSEDVDRESADRLSAVASGMIGLAYGFEQATKLRRAPTNLPTLGESSLD